MTQFYAQFSKSNLILESITVSDRHLDYKKWLKEESKENGYRSEYIYIPLIGKDFGVDSVTDPLFQTIGYAISVSGKKEGGKYLYSISDNRVEIAKSKKINDLKSERHDALNGVMIEAKLGVYIKMDEDSVKMLSSWASAKTSDSAVRKWQSWQKKDDGYMLGEREEFLCPQIKAACDAYFLIDEKYFNACFDAIYALNSLKSVEEIEKVSLQDYLS